MRNTKSSGLHVAGRLVLAGTLAIALVTGMAPMSQAHVEGGLASSAIPDAAPASALPAAVPAAAPTPKQALAKLTLEQRVGQVLMMGVPATGAGKSDLSTLTRYKIGNVFLKGRSSAGVKSTKAVVAKISATVSASSTGGQKRFVATDQEGGNVQVLKGPGFSVMPTALRQGTWSTTTIRSNATTWAKQLSAAGINVNLAPVADTVPSAAFAPYNSPIGYWHREFGYTSGHVANDVAAFAQGMRAGGVAPVVKHFPGLGRVTRNTDTSSNVKDTTTTRTSAYIKPFAKAVAGGTRWVMVSNAYYTKIDAGHPGPFSSTIMKTMLRKDLGFTGIVVSDDMCTARQLSPWSYATRAKNFFKAGGTMMLCVNAAAIPSIHQALVAEAKASPAFRAKIDAAALEVLETRAGK
ncbi:glycoside hydrolase family 3 N-terminal domain-containing protein [Paeniglutamicibacter sp. NPDC012692]|uniref:glycoside hydrolase family 3 N-terminal domain-containing protein n=1 Tax=Paeniglutamicibacter sp. NPDC012692 TaxID=3364388 RepID=UPI0036B4CEE0